LIFIPNPAKNITNHAKQSAPGSMSSIRQANTSNIAPSNTFYALKMNDHGLQNSIWAPGGNFDYSKRVGNWICPSCGFSNFAWRKVCFRCPPAPHANGLVANGHPPTSTDSVNRITTSHRESHHVQVPNSTSFQTNYPTVNQREPGLSTSRWAPRNHLGRTSSDEIWTRVCFHSQFPYTLTDSRRLFLTTYKPPRLPPRTDLTSASRTKFSTTFSQ
jgi:hypothetical protein